MNPQQFGLFLMEPAPLTKEQALAILAEITEKAELIRKATWLEEGSPLDTSLSDIIHYSAEASDELLTDINPA